MCFYVLDICIVCCVGGTYDSGGNFWKFDLMNWVLLGRGYLLLIN